MSAPRSFRARLVSGSLLWTFGVLLAISACLILFLATHPRPHATILTWFITAPLSVSLAVGLGSMAIGAYRIWQGWQSIDRVRVDLVEVRRGTASQLTGHYPAELQPLVDDLNALLAARDERVARAAARAADAAHGLKTPLALLARDVEEVAARDAALGASLAAHVARMSRQVDYHLSQTRVVAAGATTGLYAPVVPAIEGLFRALGRLHVERELTLVHDVPADAAVRCSPADLDELLGNLLDNACKWAHSRVGVSSRHDAGRLSIIVDDDGDGIPEELMTRVVQRGVRADERVPGTGLGLAIVHDLAELYGGSISLARSPLGGLRVELTLRRA